MVDCDTKYRIQCKDIKQEKIVLIGGPFDREIIYIDANTVSYVRMQIVNPRTDANDSETYMLSTIRGASNFYRIGIHSSMNQDSAQERLIDYYNEDNSRPINRPNEDDE
jgi:hypothetical protein